MPFADLQPFLRLIPAFGLLGDDDLEYLAEQLETQHYTIGQVICRSGDEGDSLYLVYSGRVRAISVSGDTETTVGTLSRGDHFGEQAVLTGAMRAFTVRAAEDSVLLCLSQEGFRKVVARRPELRQYFAQHVNDLATRNFLRLCSSLRTLTPQEIQAILDHVETQTYVQGEIVFRQGDRGDRFYLIRSGRVRVILDGSPIARLSDGQFFGELALLTGDGRAATVVAETDLSTLTLSAENFARLIRQCPRLRESIESVAFSYRTTPHEVEASPLGVAPQPAPEAADAAVEMPDKPQPGRFGRKWPVVRQIGEMDCGAACLSMIGKFYGRDYQVPTLRELAEVGREGASLRGLSDAAEKLGFRTRPIKAELHHLEKSRMPLIAHWGGNHFIVVYEIRKGTVLVADPGRGLRKLSEKEFKEGWTGIAMLVEPATELAPSEKAPTLLHRFLPLVKPYWPLLTEVLILSLLLEVLSLATPLFTQVIVDRVIIHRDVSMLNLMLGGMVVVVIFQLLTSALRQYLLVYTVRRIDVSMAVQFLSHILKLPTRYFENTRVGDVVTRFDETAKVRNLLTSTALTVLLDVMTIVVYVAVMLAYSPVLTAIMLITIPSFAVLSLCITPLLRDNHRNSYEAHCQVQSHLVETITGVQVVKAACAERPVRWTWENLLLKHIRLQFQAMNYRLLLDSLGTVMQVSATTALLWYGARLVMDGQLTVGQLMAFFALSGTLMGSIVGVIGVWDEVQNVRLSLERLADVLDSKPEEPQGAASLPNLPPVRGHIKFEKVTFRYSEQARTNALENVDLEILPGQTVALIGRSGCGKSTLIKMLMRLYEPNSGRITVDGQDIGKINLASWRTQVGLVAQDSFLFSGTIRENIALGHPHATMDDIRRAAILAGAHDFIAELPLGYNTLVGERGSSLSGGQRQRINIARALLANPRVLIMDEATSALDTESERAIQRNMETVLRDRTTLVIAHRLSTVRNADLIVVMDKGVIVEKGNHEELMQARGLYFYLCSQQLDQ